MMWKPISSSSSSSSLLFRKKKSYCHHCSTIFILGLLLLFTDASQQQQQQKENKKRRNMRFGNKNIVNSNNHNHRNHRRKLLSKSFYKYTPITDVMDNAMIDLDQYEMWNNLIRYNLLGFDNAKQLYRLGAHSQSYAHVTLDAPLTKSLSTKSTQIMGQNSFGQTVTGYLLEDAPIDSNKLNVVYDVKGGGENPDDVLKCQIGVGMNPITDGCFHFYGQLKIHTFTKNITGTNSVNINSTTTVATSAQYHHDEMTVSYSYDPIADTHNARTIEKFSTEAESLMYSCKYKTNCPHQLYKQFYDYYGRHNYGDEIIQKAFTSGTFTNILDSNKNIALSNFNYPSRAEIIGSATIILNMWMYIIHSMEEAINICNEGTCTFANSCIDGVHSWDKAVAYYSGSDISQSKANVINYQTRNGYLFYRLANEHCEPYKACGVHKNNTVGMSYVNELVFHYFEIGKMYLLRNECNNLMVAKSKIVQLMTIPLIQGVIQNAFYLSQSTTPRQENKALGLIYTASILPMIHNCNPDDASILFNDMVKKSTESSSLSHNPIDFKKIKQLLEKNYKCLGISCGEIGGLYNSYSQQYFKDSTPCSEQSEQTQSQTQGSNNNSNSNKKDKKPWTHYNPSKSNENYKTNMEKLMDGGLILALAAIAFFVAIIIVVIGCCTWKVYPVNFPPPNPDELT